MEELDGTQRLVAQTVRQFVDREVIPVASEMEHRDEYPDRLVETMKELGLFGLNIPEEYGGNEVDYTTFAIVFEELARGWMGLAGILGAHLVLCDVLVRFGTDAQKQQYLPRLARGEPRGGICLSEPNAGADLRPSTTAPRGIPISERPRCGSPTVDGRRYSLTGQTIRRFGPHRGISAFVIEKGAPDSLSAASTRWATSLAETHELHFQDFPVPVANLIGGEEEGIQTIDDRPRAERLNVAARGLGVAQRRSKKPSSTQQRHAFGKPIAHRRRFKSSSPTWPQDRGIPPADLPCRRQEDSASSVMSRQAWPNLRHRNGGRGVARAMRILGGNSFSKDFRSSGSTATLRFADWRGTGELQRLIIARGLLERYTTVEINPCAHTS